MKKKRIILIISLIIVIIAAIVAYVLLILNNNECNKKAKTVTNKVKASKYQLTGKLMIIMCGNMTLLLKKIII